MSRKKLDISLRASTLTLEEYMDESPDIQSSVTQCPICISMLIEPVTLLCGHSFCRVCELKCFANREGIKSCALCRSCYSDKPKINIVLHDILKCVLGNKYTNECIKRNSECIKFESSRGNDGMHFPNYPVDLEYDKITKNCLTI
jgi:Zinc finger, C3HC4 type (RING finger)